MTERTTTEIVERIEQLQEDRGGEEAHEIAELFIDLDAALPAQWPHAKKIEELRAKVAKCELALHEIRSYRSLATEAGQYVAHEAIAEFERIAEEALKP
jgi:hypothetical protein